MRRGNRLLGVVSWQASFGASDHLLMALPQGSEEEDVRALLVHALKRVPSTRAISMDYPAGQFQGAIQAAGFDERQTLIWMVLPL